MFRCAPQVVLLLFCHAPLDGTVTYVNTPLARNLFPLNSTRTKRKSNGQNYGQRSYVNVELTSMGSKPM